MPDHDARQAFLDAADAWVCDGYSTDIRFLAGINGDTWQIWDAAIGLNPLPAKRDYRLLIESGGFVVGQIQRDKEGKSSLQVLLERAASGVIELPGKKLTLLNGERASFYSEMDHRSRWFSDLHLKIGGDFRPPTSPNELARIDGVLRGSNPPFDGLADVTSWLGLAAPGAGTNATINIRVNPPVDLLVEKCALLNDRLSLTLLAHSNFDVTHVGLAVRAVPIDGLHARRQMAERINWGPAGDAPREGHAQIELSNTDSALVMLMAGSTTVRRQWFLDPAKARNNRFLAVQHFDRDLRMIRAAVMESNDATRFETGIAALLFLLGFSPVVQLETDSPDLVVSTPNGRLIVVEATTRIADFASKVGKLVDRRRALTKALQAAGHPTDVAAALVCRQPRDQIAARADELKKHKAILISGDDLSAAFDRVRFAQDPDNMLREAEARFALDTRTLT